jgi:hypothetical protein
MTSTSPKRLLMDGPDVCHGRTLSLSGVAAALPLRQRRAGCSIRSGAEQLSMALRACAGLRAQIGRAPRGAAAGSCAARRAARRQLEGHAQRRLDGGAEGDQKGIARGRRMAAMELEVGPGVGHRRPCPPRPCRGRRARWRRWRRRPPRPRRSRRPRARRCAAAASGAAPSLAVVVGPGPAQHVFVQHVPLRARQHARAGLLARRDHALGLEWRERLAHRGAGHAQLSASSISVGRAAPSSQSPATTRRAMRLGDGHRAAPAAGAGPGKFFMV